MLRLLLLPPYSCLPCLHAPSCLDSGQDKIDGTAQYLLLRLSFLSVDDSGVISGVVVVSFPFVKSLGLNLNLRPVMAISCEYQVCK